MAPPVRMAIAIFLMLLLGSSSCRLSQARMMPSDDAHLHAKKRSALIATTSAGGASPQDLLLQRQRVAEPSKPEAKAATEMVNRPDDSGWTSTQGSVPSPGIGHHA
ncbi:hypothetical protein BRADI_2g32833v3 [Brachypodium distachyon]|uniref:Uncharacterized protein n=1 Tax=Brachypodium distachyon TaxID=15368 RepID=I1HKY8_BRADI|nr:hypothetical protein BRADI_2g32833v3 [Brachypodium distachyon]